jgi:glycosyltransferase involved in cell wall biosynthesis
MNEPRPARILFLAGGSAGTNVYGAERSLLDLIAGMDRTRFLPCCAVTQGAGPYVSALHSLGVAVVDLRLGTSSTLTPAGLLAAASGTRALIRIARQAQADLIHVNALKVNPYAVLAAGALAASRARAGEGALGLPVVLHLQGHVNKRAYFTWLAFGASRIVACSQAVALPWQGMPGGKRRLRVVYYGLDPAPFGFSEERRAKERARLGLPSEVFAVGVVSRLSPSKKLETFFQALQHMAMADRRIIALVAGDAPPYWRQYGEMIRQLPKQMGISDRVVFLGYVKDMAPLYSAFDAVVAPSDVEGLCRVILEAMAASRPVIAVRAGGPVEVVEDAVTGLLVPPQDPRALGQAITHLAQDDALCRRLGDAAVRRVAERFSLAAYVRSLQDAYTELLAESGCSEMRRETSQHAL